MSQHIALKGIFVLCIMYGQLMPIALPISNGSCFPVGNNGIILYVGGDGPGNFSSIQSAINAANNGDTVYVYNGIYFETVVINKTISLLGEDKNDTILNGNGNKTVVMIESNGVIFNNITVTGGGGDDFDAAGVYITSDYVVVKDAVIISNEGNGIYLFSASHCTLSHILLKNNRYGGIYLSDESDATNISYNNIDSGISGINIFRSNQSIISYNQVVNCSNGIYLSESHENKILNNHLSYNQEGLFCYYAVHNTIQFNNFISNERNARFMKFLHIGFFAPNTWSHNYWDDWIQIGVKIIFGGMYVRTFSIIGIFVPWVEIDWHPASEPN